MIHQITLLGGQILPVYIGIVERRPNVVHIIYTKETAWLRKRLVKNISGCKIYYYQVEPYDYHSVEETVTKIMCDNEEATFELNLTSGTKLMALASQEVFKTLECYSFYIDQSQHIIDLSNGQKDKIKTAVSTKKILSLSGHDSFTSIRLGDFNSEEKELAQNIFNLRKSKSGINELFKKLRSIDSDPDAKQFSHIDKLFRVEWNKNVLSVHAPNFNLKSTGSNSFKILTTGLWWEIIIGLAVSSWKSIYEYHMSLVIKTNTNKTLDKNEVDILINTGQKIVFIECKSGIVKQSDINKMRAISKFYGGISSKSILVSYYKPKNELIEKCQDFGIGIFHFSEFSNNKQNKLNSISNKLDGLISKTEI